LLYIANYQFNLALCDITQVLNSFEIRTAVNVD
jgi:hypothetical protein